LAKYCTPLHQQSLHGQRLKSSAADRPAVNESSKLLSNSSVLQRSALRVTSVMSQLFDAHVTEPTVSVAD
jgi:hypothetical protein